MIVKFKKLHPNAILPIMTEGNAGMDLTAVSVRYDSEHNYLEYDTGIAVDLEDGYFGLLAARSSVSNKNLTLCNGIGILDSSYKGSLKLRFKAVKHDNQWQFVNNQAYEEIERYDYYKEEKLLEDYFKEALLEFVREDTPHGKCGVDEHTSYFKGNDKYFKVTVSNIQWDRHDKQFYFMDSYSTPKITIEEATEDQLPTVTIEGIYEIGNRIGQLIILPYPTIETEWTDKLSESDRGDKGFGSSGS